MQIFIKVKSISRKKPIFEMISMEIDDNITNANDLISCIVNKNVKEFNNKDIDKPLFTYLTNEQIAHGEQIGKIGFNDKKNEVKQDEEQAVDNALTCFYDGIFRLYIGEDEVVYDQTIKLNENDELTFIRLTMLAGRLF